MALAETCPVCESPLSSNGYCAVCADDADQARREHGAWREYVEKYRERIGAIAEVAQQVCEREELELLGAELLGWEETRIAGFHEISVQELGKRREAIHEKIRTKMGQDKIAEVTRRRR